jgi:hypothetical protein
VKGNELVRRFDEGRTGGMHRRLRLWRAVSTGLGLQAVASLYLV